MPGAGARAALPGQGAGEAAPACILSSRVRAAAAGQATSARAGAARITGTSGKRVQPAMFLESRRSGLIASRPSAPGARRKNHACCRRARSKGRDRKSLQQSGTGDRPKRTGRPQTRPSARGAARPALPPPGLQECGGPNPKRGAKRMACLLPLRDYCMPRGTRRSAAATPRRTRLARPGGAARRLHRRSSPARAGRSPPPELAGLREGPPIPPCGGVYIAVGLPGTFNSAVGWPLMNRRPKQ